METRSGLLPPRYAQEVYERAPEPKEVSWIETTNHVELYDGVPHVPQALERIVAWLDENLKARRARSE